MSAVPEPRAEWFSTSRIYKLVGCPDVKSARGHTFLAEMATVHDDPVFGPWVWVEGRAVRQDGSIGTARRGRGFDIARKEGSKVEPAPDWLLTALRKSGWTDG